jgi:hypothetical protein
MAFTWSVQSQNTIGTIFHSTGAAEGYTLFEYMGDTNIYLIDNCGRVVNQWHSNYTAGTSVYLLEDGSIMRAGRVPATSFPVGGQGGVLERFDWDGNLIWQFFFTDTLGCLHHDFEVLPNGNVLAITFEKISAAEAIASGRDSNLLGDGELWPEKIIEFQPVGFNNANIVWEWRMWDHLIQDFDSTKSNYGVVADHPERFDLNFVWNDIADWAHANAIDYNPHLDQIAISLNFFDELIIIDHSTTIQEAASSSGGNSGKGGDILYRYGNPEVFDRGDSDDRVNYRQHDVQWISDGLTDAGKIMFYNNGNGRPEGNFSSIDIITPAMDANGNYILEADFTFAPDSAEWSYTAPTPTDFFSPMISGAQRLPNGNTLICQGRDGRLFEIDGTTEAIVWEYISPINNIGIMAQGDTPSGNRNVFRAVRYPSSFSGFTGNDLTPMDPIELNPNLGDCLVVDLDEFNTNPDEFKTFPNPVIDWVFIETSQLDANSIIEIHTIEGSLVERFAYQPSLNLSNLPSGVYILSAGELRTRLIKE